MCLIKVVSTELQIPTGEGEISLYLMGDNSGNKSFSRGAIFCQVLYIEMLSNDWKLVYQKFNTLN